jgi:hypothetical protein
MQRAIVIRTDCRRVLGSPLESDALHRGDEGAYVERP